MLTHLINTFTPSTTPSGTPCYWQLWCHDPWSSSPTRERHHRTLQLHNPIFRYHLPPRRSHRAGAFLDNVETRIRKLRNDSLSSNPAQLQIGSAEVTRLVRDVLQPVALDAIHEREGRDRSMNATQTYPVFVAYIRRSRAGRILTEPTSFPS
ncbi:hypothetical protein AFLA_010899 [Aspergillus flavus NRRL3357]|nr:hypothetical protein AFLA_010899 [Aspergillus flavus NRRL3357]